MHISYRWLGRHVDLTGISPQKVAEDLTLSTAEVEGLTRFLPHLSKTVVGLVVERDKHPDADKLSVCKLDVGTGELQQIVCGAPNVAAGQKVCVALPGTELPGDFKIKKSKIRGVESNGMICSERELGLGDEHSGIWVLPATAQVGKGVAEELGLDDWVIEIDNKSLTHRPDLWGHRGIAGEIAAMHGLKLKPLSFELPATGKAQPFPVRIEASGCSRYIALPIDGVAAVRSPDWLRALLFAVGQRPIDLLVDVSNFVMLDLAQPNHVFDRTRLSSEGIVVRNARANESMKTLDGLERKLVATDMLITSGDKPVALAGVMGDDGSQVEGATRSLLLEVAAFAPAVVRRTSQRLALRTDSSARFEKSLDPTLPMKAAAHFVNTLKALAPELTLPSSITDVGEWKDPSHTIPLRTARVRSLLGADIPDAKIASILTSLSFGVKGSGATLEVTVPSARATKDVTIEQDLVEEVGRIHRYGNIAEQTLIAAIQPPPRDARWKRRMLVRAVQDRLSGAARFHETLSYSFVGDELLAKIGADKLSHVAVVNPVAEGFSKMRRSVVPSLLAALETNRRQREVVQLFEVGKGYLPEHANEKGEPREVHECALVLAAVPAKKGARFDDNSFARLRGIVDDLVASLELDRPQWKLDTTPESWSHTKSALVATLGDSAPIAHLAALDPRVRRNLGLTGELESDVACAVISIDALLAAPPRTSGYKPVPKFPAVKVDVALATSESTTSGQLVAAIEKSGKGLVSKVELFDLYKDEESGEGKNPSQRKKLGEGKKSLAYHVHLSSDQKTLGEAEVQKFLERLERELKELGAELRKV
ncbi:MAG: phenylalanine--tRNA ligase subunit beta [Planctomycetes bacterium]|nr:phenylalanine--tRNA ligase subunit beta [Planctomycetota bacterium]